MKEGKEGEIKAGEKRGRDGKESRKGRKEGRKGRE